MVERRAIKRELLMKMSEDIKIIEEDPHNVDDSIIKSPVKVISETPASDNKKKKNKSSAKKKTEIIETPSTVKVENTIPTKRVEEVKKTIEI